MCGKSLVNATKHALVCATQARLCVVRFAGLRRALEEVRPRLLRRYELDEVLFFSSFSVADRSRAALRVRAGHIGLG